MAGGNSSEKKRKRKSDANAVHGSINNQTARKKRKQDSDDNDDDDSVWQASSLPVSSSSRQYAKPTAKPTGLVASSFLAKRRGIPKEIAMDSDDDQLPTLASIFSASQRASPREQQPSQRGSSSSTPSERRRQAGRDAVASPSDTRKGTDKTPYRRPRGPLVNLGTFELDEDGNDVEELARKRAARKRRREESRHSKDDDSDDSIVECSSPVAQSQQRTQVLSTRNSAAKPSASRAPEVIVLDSDEGEARTAVTQTPTAKRRRRFSPKRVVQSSTPSPLPRSPRPAKECSPSRASSPNSPARQSTSDLDQSFEILSHAPSPKGETQARDAEAGDETVIYEPGQLQGIYNDEIQRMQERTRNLKSIVPRKKSKAFSRASLAAPVLPSPTYTHDYSEAIAILTSSIWSRSVRNWVASSSRSTSDVITCQGETNTQTFSSPTSAAEVEGLLLIPRMTDKGVEVCDDDLPQGLGSAYPAAEDDSQDPCEARSDVIVSPELSLQDPLTAMADISNCPPPDDVSAGTEDAHSPAPPISTPATLCTDSGQDKSPCVQNSLTVSFPSASPFPPDHAAPRSRDRPPQYDKDDAIVTAALDAMVKRRETATERESLRETALVELYTVLKAEHTQHRESSPTLSSRQSSATLASQSDDTESSSRGPVTPVHSDLGDPLAALAGFSAKHAPDIDSFMDDDSLSMDGSQLELVYPD